MATGFELILAAICLNSTACMQGIPLQNNSDTMQFSMISQNGNSSFINILDEKKTEMAKQNRLKEMQNWLNGRKLRIATIDDFPLSYTEKKNGEIVGKGVSFALVDFLAKKYNFTYDVIKPDNDIIGSSYDMDKSLIELLNQSRADMAAAFIPLLSLIRQHVAYSETTLDEGEWIMIMQRPPDSASGSGLLAPFTFDVWILIMISLLAVGPIIYGLIMLRNKLTKDDSQYPYSLGHCVWFVYGALMKQGSTLSPIADSTRLLFATWWIFITILTSFYTANLTAFLTLSKFVLPFNEVDDVLKAQKNFVASRGRGLEYAIKTENEILSKLNTMVQKNKVEFVNTSDTTILRTFVEQKSFLYIRDRPATDHMLYNDYKFRKTIDIKEEKIHCPFAKAKNPFMTKKRAFAYPLNSNLSLIFDPELLNLVESGIVKHLSAENLPNAEICPQNLASTERQLRNGDLMMTYYIMLAGFATAIVVFFTELIFRCLNARRERFQDEEFLRRGNVKNIAWNKNRNGIQTLSNNNITPPPPYTSIYNQSRQLMQNLNRINEIDPEKPAVKKLINGRDYIVYRNIKGENQLIPLRAPSATLFQYSYVD
ncbi:glutamate receptor ionotropic, kainate 2 [Condylostylus longicornis]|uniref:glutamate receptor ionotropic, kainate 2 n=1 Tax=Condylostylus longicornis TaxID=2530218 RepID=UPI00244DBB9B|nr:glutamate receptor ionotropic, kainate 2 [Condylostylus longicornis]